MQKVKSQKILTVTHFRKPAAPIGFCNTLPSFFFSPLFFHKTQQLITSIFFWGGVGGRQWLGMKQGHNTNLNTEQMLSILHFLFFQIGQYTFYYSKGNLHLQSFQNKHTAPKMKAL